MNNQSHFSPSREERKEISHQIDFAKAEEQRKGFKPQLISQVEHKPLWFESLSGQRIYPTQPDAGVVVVRDIAHALSHCCRFAGHCREFYSVATHSLLVLELVGSQTDCIHTQAAALMHDASEAYLHDITRPLKMQMPWYRELEACWETEIMHKLGIDACRVDWDLVKDADNEALRLEAIYLIRSQGKDWDIPISRTFKSMHWFFDPHGATDMDMPDTCDEFESVWNDVFAPALKILSRVAA